jgi:hypothetical protein
MIPNLPLKKYYHHGGAVCRAQRHGRWCLNPPPPGNLFVMSRVRAHMKDFLLLCKLAREMIYLVKASILFYFLQQPNSIVSKTIILSLPCAPHWSRIISYPSPVAPACFWLVVVWHSLSGGHLRSRLYFFFQLLSSINSMAKQWHGVHHTRSSPAASPPQPLKVKSCIWQN